MPDDWRSELVLDGHSGWISAIAFSPNGQLLASASIDKSVRLWNPENGTACGNLEGHMGAVQAVSFSPDGELLATGSDDHTVRLWNMRACTPICTLKGHTSSIKTVAFSSDGQLISSLSSGGIIRLWEAKSARPCGALEGHTSEVQAVVFSPDGTLLAAACSDGKVRLWNTKAGTARSTLDGHLSTVNAIAFSPDGRILASGSEDHTVRLWNAIDGSARSTLQGHSEPIRGLTFSTDGQMLASISRWEVWLWNHVAGESCRQEYRFEISYSSVQFMPRSHKIAVYSWGELRLWDEEENRLLELLEIYANDLGGYAFSPDGHLLAIGTMAGNIKLRHTTASPSSYSENPMKIKPVEFSPNGELLAVTYSKTIDIWNVQTRKFCFSLYIEANSLRNLAFSPDSKMLASSSHTGTVVLWDLTQGTMIDMLDAGSRDRQHVFSPDGKQLATGTDAGMVVLWKLSTGGERHQLEGHSNEVTALTFSPDGRLLASGSKDSTVRLWDVTTGAECCIYECHSTYVRAVAFSPDGRHLASSHPYSILLWELQSHQLLRSFRNSQPIEQLSFSPDGSCLVTNCEVFPIHNSDAEAFLRDLHCLTVVDNWVVHNKRKILWLPPYYRFADYAVHDCTIALARDSKNVIFFTFDFRSGFP